MKMTVIKKEHLDKMSQLMAMKVDNAYFTIYEKDGYKTICQYSDRYDNLHIVTIWSDTLAQSQKACLD